MSSSPTHAYADPDQESLSKRMVRWSMVGAFLSFIEHLTAVNDLVEADKMDTCDGPVGSLKMVE